MAKATIRKRLKRLENNRRFLDWFVQSRFYESFTAVELDIFARDGKLPDPLSDRPSRLDRLDRKVLLKLWEEDERSLGGEVTKS